PGNRAGRGNPSLRRQHALQQAVRQAVGPDDLQRVLRKLVDLSERGDVQAASLLLSHAVGRPREAPGARVDLPPLDTAAGIADGLATLGRAAAAGEIDSSDASRVAGILAQVLDATVVRQLEDRIAAIEAARTTA
ncbi:MAG: hypothetical protein JNN13_04450, partial [Planctomycetes bacterium]|nr:hypothetical protein [Planctomycetota bacterium]